jgi:hypothetical protein
MNLSPDLIVYTFSREKVERGDFSHFLGLYAVSRLPHGPALKALMGSFMFAIEGYDNDAREIYLIPEVHRFYRAFHPAWPHWLFFYNLRHDSLKTMVICCLQTFATFKVHGRANCAVEFDTLELIEFIARDLPSMNAMCERAGMTEREILERSRDVFHFFGLPYGAHPE